ncbi:MAG: YlbF family regulator [Verrucomicrobiales bacterium]|nr:YlbF family regulator [Verrucomicrobiales bacterium]
MQTSTQESAIQKKTVELCETITTHPDFLSLKGRVDAFLTNDSARDQYNALVEQGQMLEHRQQTGGTITQEEVADFEGKRDAVLQNAIIKDFLQAQQEIQTIQRFIADYVTKTFELGRTPGEEDFQDGSCGSGCGCH